MTPVSLIIFLLSIGASGVSTPVEPAMPVEVPIEANTELEGESPEAAIYLHLWGDNPLLMDRVSRIA